MATAKTTGRTFPIEPGRKKALRTAAHREHRSSANMAKVIAAHRAPFLGVEKTDETERLCRMNLAEGKDERN